MNQPSKQLKAMAQRLFTARSGVVHVNQLHPERDWAIGILVGVVVAISIVGWSGYTYLANRDGGTTEIDITIPNPTYQAALIDEALAIFATKAVNLSTTVAPFESPVEAIPVAIIPTEAELSEATSSPTQTVVSDLIDSAQTAPTDILEESNQSPATSTLTW